MSDRQISNLSATRPALRRGVAMGATGASGRRLDPTRPRAAAPTSGRRGSLYPGVHSGIRVPHARTHKIGAHTLYRPRHKQERTRSISRRPTEPPHAPYAPPASARPPPRPRPQRSPCAFIMPATRQQNARLDALSTPSRRPLDAPGERKAAGSGRCATLRHPVPLRAAPRLRAREHTRHRPAAPRATRHLDAAHRATSK